MRVERPLTPADEEALRARGLRPYVFWLPDLDDPTFMARIAEGCRIANKAMTGSDDMAFIEAVRYWPPDE